jgi:hypothetical protein
MVPGRLALVGERQKGPPAPFAGLNGEASFGFANAGNDKILEEAARFNVGLELAVRPGIAGPPDISRRSDQLVEWDGLDHRSVSG